MLNEVENRDALMLLREIEAYLSFKLTGENPSIDESSISDMKRDIVKCLRWNGVEI